jgi:2-octaprenyl-6-methoxyphenol hydroxylase
MASSAPRSVPAWRILIGGGGAAGLSLALALTQALGPAIQVTICDPALAQPRSDERAYAISPSVARMLDRLGIWPRLAADAQPVTRMTITDSRLDDVPRPAYLGFGDGVAPLAYMVQADRLAVALLDLCREAGIGLDAQAITGFQAAATGLVATGQDGGLMPASLLVAADGARSRLRDEAGIAWLGRSYGQTGIVATVAHRHPHGGRAIQHFLPSGPFAILPLVPGRDPERARSSLVWTERSDAVPALLQLGPEQLVREIERRTGPEIGAVTLESGLHTWPLAIGQARRAVAGRFALLGDAAHQVHPLAGHGLNLALGDVAALAERIVDAVRLGLDPGAAPVLDAYERDRRAATLAMAASTDLLNRLFSNDNVPIRAIRDLGLGLVDRAAPLKRLFIGEATGGTGSAPRLLRGDAL